MKNEEDLSDDDEACNVDIADEDIGSDLVGSDSAPSSDGSSQSTPRDDEEIDFSIELETVLTRHGSKIMTAGIPNFFGNQVLLSEEVCDEEFEENNTPNKNMISVGHIGASSVGSNYNYGGVNRTESSSIN